MAKVSLNGGMGCPNRDGTRGVGGCTYCSAMASGDFAGDPRESLREQFADQKALLSAKWPDCRYIAYFQAGTNTHAPLEKLRSLFEEALTLPGVVGLSIATRADCLPEPVLDYLEDLSRRTWLTVELGLQSAFDETGRRINRCHTTEEFLAGYEALRRRGIAVCIHLIDGLPGETADMMRESARFVGRLRPHSVKLHLLHLLEGTAMAEEYRRGEFRLLEREEYVGIICDQLELLPPETVIQRLTGDGDARLLIGPMWSRGKRGVLAEIDKELARRDSYQGRKFEP